MGIVLYIQREKLNDFLKDTAADGAHTFIIDPTKTIKYHQLEKVIPKTLNDNNHTIFYSVNSQKLLTVFLNKMASYCRGHVKAAVQCNVFINDTKVFGDISIIAEKYRSKVNDLPMSIYIVKGEIII